MRKINGFNNTEKIKGFEDAKAVDVDLNDSNKAPSESELNSTSENKLIFDEHNLLRKNDLEAGHVYVKRDGTLVLYVGIDNFGRFVFYHLAKCLTGGMEGPYHKTLAHYDLQVKALTILCESVMNRECDGKQIVTLSGIPELYTEFVYVDYTEKLQLWYSKSKALNADLPNVTFGGEPAELTVPYVKAKDLVPGELYYTGSLWRALYLYLGRDSVGNFCWYFVGNSDILMRNNFYEYQLSMERTKSNKKVKRLADAPNDPKAYMYGDALKLIQLNWKADLTGFSLQ